MSEQAADFNKDKVLERVKKMMRLANDAAASEGERDNALRMAHATLAKYNLSMAEAERSGERPDEKRMDSVLESKSTHPWERSVAQSVARLFFCHYFYQLHTGRFTRHYFIGKESNVFTAQEVFKYVVGSINREGQRVSREATGSGGGTFWRSFCKGAAAAVYKRCDQLVRDSQTQKLEHKGPGTALVLASVYEQERKANLVHVEKEMGVKLRYTTDRTRTPEATAFERGVAYGNSVNLQGGGKPAAPGKPGGLLK